MTGDFKKLPNAPSHRVVAKDVVTSTAIKNGPHKALLKTPFDLRDNAVKDAIATLKSDITKFKKAGGKFSFTHDQTDSRATMRFNQSCGCYIDLTNNNAIHKINVCPGTFKNGLQIALQEAFPFPDLVAIPDEISYKQEIWLRTT